MSECAPDQNEIHLNRADLPEACSPLIGEIITRESIEIERPEIDNFEEVVRFERRHKALDFVMDWYAQPGLTDKERALASLYLPMHSINGINNQFAAKIMPCFENPEPEEALTAFRGLVNNTIDEEMVLLTNDEQFFDLHENLHKYLAENEQQIKEDAEQNWKDFPKWDKMQFSGNQLRNLNRVLETGIDISIDSDGLERLQEAEALVGEGMIPLTEYVKNDKILKITAFCESKISLAIHDFMDHLWTFEVMQKSGILAKYADLFNSIGNPQLTDIFRREGEMVASIAFGVRLHQGMPIGFGPTIRASQIEEMMDRYFAQNQLETRHHDALRIIKNLRKGSHEWASLGFTYSNYVTELNEQRRKFGKIKQRDTRTYETIGELDTKSPDFLGFFIETHHEILNPKNKHRNDLFRCQIVVEEYLREMARGHLPPNTPLTLNLNQLRKEDLTKTTLPADRLNWMQRNYGFTATKDALV
jgi:hypothetical protein